MPRLNPLATQALLLLLVSSACAQAPDGSAEAPEPVVDYFPYTLEVGDVVVLEFTRSREESGTGTRKTPTHLESAYASKSSRRTTKVTSLPGRPSGRRSPMP